MNRSGGLGWRLVAAALSPFAIVSIYLFLTRWPSYRFSALSDHAALAGSVLVGAAFIATLPVRAQHRALSLLVYLPVMAALVFFYAFWFVGVVFHDGL